MYSLSLSPRVHWHDPRVLDAADRLTSPFRIDSQLGLVFADSDVYHTIFDRAGQVHGQTRECISQASDNSCLAFISVSFSGALG